MEALPSGELLSGKLGISPFAAEMALSRLTASDAAPRIREWFTEIAASRVIVPQSPWQRGCPEVIPRLQAAPVWYRDGRWIAFDAPESIKRFVSALETAHGDILTEFMALRGRDLFQEYRSPSWSSRVAVDAAPAGPPRLGVPATAAGGNWNVAYLQLHNAADICEENQKSCPRTASILEAAPRSYHHSFFSALAPGSHITPHVGSTNKKLRIHLPLVVPAVLPPTTDSTSGSCSSSASGDASEATPAAAPPSLSTPAASTLRVGDTVCTMEPGKALVFDDSFEHEAFTHSLAAGPRVTLIVDVWHPDLSDSEVGWWVLHSLSSGW
jgi:aspartate beta-hydroxylase